MAVLQNNMQFFFRALIFFLALFLFSVKTIFSQELNTLIPNENKGKFYFYWGWNQSEYTHSDIHFTGEDYSFSLANVKATDRQTQLSATYINPGTATIPQYNFRFGYFFKENFSVSIGNDHMKYVVTQNQAVEITGDIEGTDSGYDGSYDQSKIELTEDFLIFEHTDGLNYENIDVRHHFKLLDFHSFRLNLQEGVGAGIMFPKTNSTLLGNERYDEFHIAGYGINAILALNFIHKSGIFLQSEAKLGYINMPDIRTTKFTSDRAAQDFFFFQYNIVFGYRFGKVKQNQVKE